MGSLQRSNLSTVPGACPTFTNTGAESPISLRENRRATGNSVDGTRAGVAPIGQPLGRPKPVVGRWKREALREADISVREIDEYVRIGVGTVQRALKKAGWCRISIAGEPVQPTSSDSANTATC